jgi:hypothetical protein
LVPLFDIVAQPRLQYRLLPHGTGAAALFANWLRGVCAAVEQDAQAVLSAARGKIIRHDPGHAG